MESNKKTEIATLGGGCFWCLQPVYEPLNGVEKVVVGYAGGHDPNPTYRAVCNGTTGHAEVAQVTFDPSVISFEDVLHVFFTVHDPTTLNRQGADAGTQYRSAIYFHSPEQKATADRVIAEVNASGAWRSPVVTEVTAAPTFHIAEEYHQSYYDQHPEQGYCQAVIAPKVAKLRAKYMSMLKKPAA